MLSIFQNFFLILLIAACGENRPNTSSKIKDGEEKLHLFSPTEITEKRNLAPKLNEQMIKSEIARLLENPSVREDPVYGLESNPFKPQIKKSRVIVLTKDADILKEYMKRAKRLVLKTYTSSAFVQKEYQDKDLSYLQGKNAEEVFKEFGEIEKQESFENSKFIQIKNVWTNATNKRGYFMSQISGDDTNKLCVVKKNKNQLTFVDCAHREIFFAPEENGDEKFVIYKERRISNLVEDLEKRKYIEGKIAFVFNNWSGEAKFSQKEGKFIYSCTNGEATIEGKGP